MKRLEPSTSHAYSFVASSATASAARSAASVHRRSAKRSAASSAIGPESSGQRARTSRDQAVAGGRTLASGLRHRVLQEALRMGVERVRSSVGGLGDAGLSVGGPWIDEPSWIPALPTRPRIRSMPTLASADRWRWPSTVPMSDRGRAPGDRRCRRRRRSGSGRADPRQENEWRPVLEAGSGWPRGSMDLGGEPSARTHGAGECAGFDAARAHIDQRSKLLHVGVALAPVPEHHGRGGPAAECFGLRQKRDRQCRRKEQRGQRSSLQTFRTLVDRHDDQDDHQQDDDDRGRRDHHRRGAARQGVG